MVCIYIRLEVKSHTHTHTNTNNFGSKSMEGSCVRFNISGKNFQRSSTEKIEIATFVYLSIAN